jgi:hypothetical protein
MKLLFSLALLLALSLSLEAKQLAPKPVKPIVNNGIKISIVKWKHQNGKQNGGFLKAVSIKTKEIVWETLVYKTKYIKNLETDVQDVFITSLSLSSDKTKLIVRNENNKTYYMDIANGKVVPKGI